MRRARKASVALAVLGVLIAAAPLAAQAEDAEVSLTGTYAGTASGSGSKVKAGSTTKKSKAKKRTTAVTLYVVQEGDLLNVTVVAAALPAPVDFIAGPIRPSSLNDWSAPFTIDEAGITGSGTLSFSYRGDGYLLAGSGRGKALGWQGSGRVGAFREALETKSTAELLAEGAGGMVGALFGGPSETKPSPPDRPEVTALVNATDDIGAETDIDKALGGPGAPEPAPEPGQGEPGATAGTTAPAEATDAVEAAVYGAAPPPFIDAGYVVLLILVLGLIALLVL